MKRYLILLCCLLAMACSSSTAQTQAAIQRDATVSANATATTLETMQSLALVLYRTEQDLQIAGASSKQDAVEKVAVVRKAWLPVWTAFSNARISYGLLVQLLASGTATETAIQAGVTQQSLNMTAVTNELSIARSRVQGGIK